MFVGLPINLVSVVFTRPFDGVVSLPTSLNVLLNLISLGLGSQWGPSPWLTLRLWFFNWARSLNNLTRYLPIMFLLYMCEEGSIAKVSLPTRALVIS